MANGRAVPTALSAGSHFLGSRQIYLQYHLLLIFCCRNLVATVHIYHMHGFCMLNNQIAPTFHVDRLAKKYF